MHERDLEAARRVGLARRFFSRAAASDVEGMLEMMAPEAELEPLAASGRAYSGPEGLRRFFGELRDEQVEVRLIPHSFEEVSGRVVVTGSLRRRTEREIAERTTAWVLRFDEQGRIACIDAFGTKLAAYRALGPRAEE